MKSHELSTLTFLFLYHFLFPVDFRAYPTKTAYREVPQDGGTPVTSKRMSRVGLISFATGILVIFGHKVRYHKI